MTKSNKKYSGIWIFIEHFNNKLEPISKELLGKGKELSNITGEKLSGILLGDNIKNLSKDVIAYGADDVYVADHPELKHFRPLPYTHVVSNLVIKHSPKIFILGATTTSNNLASRVAARVDTGLASVCTDYQIGDREYLRKNYKNLLLQIRPDFNGNYLSTIITPNHLPQMATTGPGVFDPLKKDEKRTGKVIDVDVNVPKKDCNLIVKEIVTSDKGSDLVKSKIIISGGRGVEKDPEKGFNLIRDFSRSINASVGASRGAVMAKYIDGSHQVGQTGVSVKPNLYIAAGISGAPQHIIGMKKSDLVLAINTDKNAPIFEYSDYGIVGNLFEWIPKIKAALQKNKK